MRFLAEVLSELEISVKRQDDAYNTAWDIGAKKQALRKQLLRERERERLATPPEEWGPAQGKRLFKRLAEESTKKWGAVKSPAIGAYLPIRGELDFRTLFAPEWILPVAGPAQQLRWFRFGDSTNTLVLGKYGIPEVRWEDARELSSWGNEIVLFVPALAATANGDRLGYGGGYYDKLLAENGKRILSVCCVPTCGFFDALPTDAWDAKVDVVLVGLETFSIRNKCTPRK